MTLRHHEGVWAVEDGVCECECPFCWTPTWGCRCPDCFSATDHKHNECEHGCLPAQCDLCAVVIHVDGPAPRDPTEVQWGVRFDDGEVELINDTVLFTTRTPQERAEEIAREQGGTVVTRRVHYDNWTAQATSEAPKHAKTSEVRDGTNS